MHQQQILNLMDLASNYDNKKCKTSSTNVHQYLELSKFNCGDPNVFRKTVQQKIKNKYQETKAQKSSPQVKCKTMEIQTQKFSSIREKKKIGTFTEEIERRLFPEQKILSSHSRMQKHDSLEKFINKKKQLFLNTSNLLMHSPQAFQKQKKYAFPIKTEGSSHKPLLCSSHQLRKNPLDLNLREKISNYGYEMDGSIYNFEDVRSNNDEEEIERQLIRNTEDIKTKDSIYSFLKSTSPLTIKRKAMDSKRVTDPFNEKNLNDIKKGVSFKKTRKKGVQIIKSPKMFKMMPPELKYPDSIYLRSKEDGISGWQHEQQS